MNLFILTLIILLAGFYSILLSYEYFNLSWLTVSYSNHILSVNFCSFNCCNLTKEINYKFISMFLVLGVAKHLT